MAVWAISTFGRLDDGTVDTTTRTDYHVDKNNHTGYAQVLEEMQGDVVQKSYTFGLDAIEEAVAASQVRRLLKDGHGSTRQLVDATGAVINSGTAQVFAYDAYGVPIGFDLAAALTTLLYSGEMTDQLTGLQYLRARYYNAATGTFNRLDPFAGNFTDPQSLHKYLYCHGDPVNSTDPNGRWAIAVGIAIGVGALVGGFMGWRNGGTYDGTWGDIGSRALQGAFFGGLGAALFLGIGFWLTGTLVVTTWGASAFWVATLVSAFIAGSAESALESWRNKDNDVFDILVDGLYGGLFATLFAGIAGGLSRAFRPGSPTGEVVEEVVEQAARTTQRRTTQEVAGVTWRVLTGNKDNAVFRAVVDRYKVRMLAGETIPEIGAYVNQRTRQIVINDGHHRVNAALEILEETGDSSHIKKLLGAVIDSPYAEWPNRPVKSWDMLRLR